MSNHPLHETATMKEVVEANLKSAGVQLLQPPPPGGSYLSVNIRGNITYVAIQFPFQGGTALYKGRLGDTITTEQCFEAAKLCALNILSQVDKHVGFGKITVLDHLDIYFQHASDWDEGPSVVDGASKTFYKFSGPWGSIQE